jgi:PAS domain S-box-containing protein
MLDGMNEQMVRIMYETLPIEVLILDSNDEIVGWNKHETRLFQRPLTAMGIDFRSYHPVDSSTQVEQVIQEMKKGLKDKASFWFDVKSEVDKTKHKVLVEFYALRDNNGQYVGCMQCTQDIEAIRQLQGERQLSENPQFESLRSMWGARGLTASSY